MDGGVDGKNYCKMVEIYQLTQKEKPHCKNEIVSDVLKN